MDLMKALTSQYMKKELPEMNVGDTVRVHVKIKEGSRERIQVFEGTIIAKKHGGIEESITVRRISYGVGCEKVFPVHAPNVVDVETVRHGKVRRAKLYYLRDRLGKAAKVKEKMCIRDRSRGSIKNLCSLFICHPLCQTAFPYMPEHEPPADSVRCRTCRGIRRAGET